jgi:hypothetical protein
VPRAILDKSHLGAITARARRQPVEDIAQRVHHREIRHFIGPADVVGLSRHTGLEHAADGGAMIKHI